MSIYTKVCNRPIIFGLRSKQKIMSSSRFQNQHIQDSDYKPREGIPDFPTAQGYRTYLAERIRTATSEKNKAALLRYQKIANESEDPKTIKAGIDRLRPKTTTSQSSPITTSRKPKEYIPDFDTTKEYKEYFEGRHKICNAGDKGKFAEFIRISSMAKNTDDIKQGIAERKRRHATASRESRERAKQKKSDNLEEATSHLPPPYGDYRTETGRATPIPSDGRPAVRTATGGSATGSSAAACPAHG